MDRQFKADKPYDNTSIDTICEQCGCRRGHHYPGGYQGKGTRNECPPLHVIKERGYKVHKPNLDKKNVIVFIRNTLS